MLQPSLQHYTNHVIKMTRLMEKTGLGTSYALNMSTPKFRCCLYDDSKCCIPKAMKSPPS
jgi:hypothetical protein